MHALGQAEQQGHLEEAARRYEANGMDDVAAALRERSANMTSSDPGSQALPMIENLAGDEERFRKLGIKGFENTDEESDSTSAARKKSTKARRPRLADQKPDNTESAPAS